MQKFVFSYIMLFISRNGFKGNEQNNGSVILPNFLNSPRRCRLNRQLYYLKHRVNQIHPQRLQKVQHLSIHKVRRLSIHKVHYLSSPKLHRLSFFRIPHRSVGTTQVSGYHTGQWVPHKLVGTTQVNGYHTGQYRYHTGQWVLHRSMGTMLRGVMLGK